MIRFADMKIYLQGTNLFSLDNIGFADPEQLGAIYPSVRSYWAWELNSTFNLKNKNLYET